MALLNEKAAHEEMIFGSSLAALLLATPQRIQAFFNIRFSLS